MRRRFDTKAARTYAQARRDIANQQDERILNERRRHRSLPFDLQPVSFATLSDLSRMAFETEYLPGAFSADTLEANHRSYEATNAPIRLTWFSDRLEIINPGGPYGIVNAANFGQPGVTDYRNPHLAEALKVLGFVQRFGVGIATARRLLAENGNPAPVFEPRETHVLVTVRRPA